MRISQSSYNYASRNTHINPLDIAIYMILTSSKDPSSKKRTKSEPLLFGDKFLGKTGDFHLIYADGINAHGFFHDHESKKVRLQRISAEKMANYSFDEVANRLSDEIRDHETLLLAKQSKDGDLITMHHLAYTVAIAAGFSSYTYESRYCFSDTEQLPRICHALFWFIQFDGLESLPVGNCAFRGHKGTDPIIDLETTESHYEILKQFKNQPLIDDLDLHQYVGRTTDRILAENKIYFSQKNPDHS